MAAKKIHIGLPAAKNAPDSLGGKLEQTGYFYSSF